MALTTQYTLEDLQRMRGPHFHALLAIASGVQLPPDTFTPKPRVTHFSDFDSSTQRAYHTLFRAIAAVNSSPFSLFATGSRIKGTWKTPEEAAAISKALGTSRTKLSDYDFFTDAGYLPDLRELHQTTGYKFDRISSQHGVAIPAPETSQDHINLNN